jgi:hypothetical protein
MSRKYKDIEELRSAYSANKEFPAEYEEEILLALAHFPELRDARIRFETVEKDEHPFSATASRNSMLGRSGKRNYIVHIARHSTLAPEEALMHHLPFEARVAAIAHELARIVQVEKKGGLKAIRLPAQGKSRKAERQADISVIEHGLGFELYTHASYLRTIPGLIEAYRHADINRLHPNEILEALPPEQLHEVHRF